MADEVRKVMATAPGVYRRGNVLVQEVQGHLSPVTKDGMLELISRHLRFMSKKEKADGSVEEKRVYPPSVVCNAVYSKPTAPVREIVSVATYPVMLPGGRVLSTSGYDETAKILVAVPPDLTLNVPDRPNQGDAKRAAEVLLEPFCEFPFMDSDDPKEGKARGSHSRSAVATLILTLLCRPAIAGPTPFFFVSKNAPSAGGSLLLKAAWRIVTGRELGMANYSHNEVEMEKLVTTWASVAKDAACLDNLVGDVGNGELCKAITATEWEGRILGYSKLFRGPFNMPATVRATLGDRRSAVVAEEKLELVVPSR